jgi:hypothetical protein
MARRPTLSRQSRRSARLDFAGLEIIGALLTPDIVARLAAFEANDQTVEGYEIPPGLKLRDEIARYYRIGEALWSRFEASRGHSVAASERFVLDLLRQCFGFDSLEPQLITRIGEREFPVRHAALDGRVPIVIAPAPAEGARRSGVDESLAQFGDSSRRRSATLLLQEYLNAREDAAWGLVSDGVTLRLMRDNISLTRPAWIEANLSKIFSESLFPDFSALWLLIHKSRFGQADAAVSDCALERWRERGRTDGVAARDKLRKGVEAALLELGQGFIENPANGALRQALTDGALSRHAFFEQLLRVVYRLIFIFAAEDRGLLHPAGTSDHARRVYAEGYSLARLRERSMRRTAWDRHADSWEGLKATFRALMRGQDQLGLPALGGLFAHGVVPDLENARIENRRSLAAIWRLAWLRPEGQPLTRVNWRDMETEELGSVYESLLELEPRASADMRIFEFAEGDETRGNARKTSGSYYTPDALVKLLLDSTLEPVLDAAEARNTCDPPAEILKLSIIDPACGSGHFLLGAARRAAARIAKHRSPGAPSQDEFQHALREVVSHCIYGVDRNPMAVELCKVALWIEALEPGKPLTFLDSHIRCGDSLIGVFDINVLRDGIPDSAYKLLPGDDKEATDYYQTKNKREIKEREKVETGFRLTAGQAELSKVFAGLNTSAEDSLEEIEEKQRIFASLMARGGVAWQLKTACDLWSSAWFAPKLEVPIRGRELAPTSGQLWEYLSGVTLYGPLIAESDRCAQTYCFFHWPVEFPDIIAKGGFDVVIGNPPWEMPEADDREFFAARVPSISAEASAHKRRFLIEALKTTSPSNHSQWVQYLRGHAGSRTFFTESRRFPNGANGRLNYYKLFLELGFLAISKNGRLGMVIPSGLTTNAYERPLWHSIVKTGFVSEIYDFENSSGLFSGIDSRVKFSLISLVKQTQRHFRTACWLADISELQEPERVISLGIEDLEKFSPDDLALPQFHNSSDLELLAFATRRHGRLSDHDDWRYTPRLMFSSSDSAFRPVDAAALAQTRLNDRNRRTAETGRVLVPVYEGKMVGIFDHRQADIYLNPRNPARQAQERPIPDAEKVAADRFAAPQFWLDEAVVRQRRFGKSQGDWELVFCDVTSATNERTTISSIVPLCGLTRSLPSIYLQSASARDAIMLTGVLSTFVVDYFSRLKVSSNHLTQGILATLPIPSKTIINEFAADVLGNDQWFEDRILELVYVSWDLAAFAKELERTTPPFRWNPARRFLLRCELDAAFFHLFLGSQDRWNINDSALIKLFKAPRQAVEYILGTFSTVNRKDEARFDGDQRTKRTILEIYDDISTAIQSRSSYRTRLRPGPANPSCCHSEPSATIDASIQVTDPWGAATQAIEFEGLPDAVWARPTPAGPGDAGAMLAAILKAMDGPLLARQVRLAAAFGLEPRLLVPHLDPKQAAEWQRLIGAEAAPLTGNAASFAPRVDRTWGSAVTAHRGNGRLVEDPATGTWAPGPGLDAIDTVGWPDGRAGMLLRVLPHFATDAVISAMPAEIRGWIDAAAA